jgi:DNA topoisomerase-2
MFQAKPKPKATGMGSDGADELSGLSDDDFAQLEAVKPSKETSRAPSEQPANGRNKRAAAAAPKKWVEQDDESESDDDNFLGDVGAMVKGIGGGDVVDDKATNGRLSLFAMSRSGPSGSERPTSSSGLPKLKTKPSRVFDSDNDETNYEMLARSSPHKAAAAPKDNLDSYLSDDDVVVAVTKKVPVKPAAAPAAKPAAKRGPKPKTAAPAPVKKPEPVEPKALSPAAKAYAAKQSKMMSSRENVFSDEDSDIEMNDSPPPKTVAKKPAPKAAAPKPAKATVRKTVISDDEEDDDDEEPVTKPVSSRIPIPRTGLKNMCHEL